MEMTRGINSPGKNVAGRKINWMSQELILLYITAAFFIIFALTADGFFSVNNIFTILRSMSIIAIIGLGITFVITAGEIDLSIGTVPALGGCLLAVLLVKGIPLPLTILITLCAVVVIGFINGLIVVKARIPSIIITLATYMIAQGIAYIISNQAPVIVTNAPFLNLFGSSFFGFPLIVFWMLFFTVVSYLLMYKTKFGVNLAYIGENRSAAYYAGINVNTVIIIAFIICSTFSLMGGMLGVAQAANATPWMITPDLMTAIAATLIGGTSLAGGKGNILGTITGAFFLTMLSNGLLILGVDQWVLYLINGVIIILALSYSYSRK
ncbi:ABC transporter permease [Paenibacillus abyssi]|uniref:Autoinducer 2 import system permease protein LsrD n=1 Tax=Paenibacillus abyssi TaxID=1340531 RepID=A0A917LET6_9BACL|nr:ABC transporter permease [Paenibacillus abyssi]GGG16812.1 ABC transporter permease [Paenibacillus abyssi]